jgi:transketolase
MAQLDSYCGDDSLLGVHPEHVLPGIDFCTGSLGHGLSMAAGAALAARFDGSSRRSFAIISDAEMNEGSTWEAVMFAAHHRLSNLYAILDLNGQQAFGYTRDVLAVPNAGERFSAFRWNVIEVDGHSIPSIVDAVGQPASDKPTVIVARTTFGKGVSYMENLIRWHYMPMSEAEYEQAMREVQST